MKVLVTIMSYNRGQFLRNLIDSIQANFEITYDLWIYDDDSDDSETLEILDEYREYVAEHKFIGKDDKHKGLYSNMRCAYNMASSQDYDLLFIFQDDTQVIRKLEKQELISIYDFFNYHDSTFQVACTFFKKNHQKPYASLLDYDQEFDMFTPKKTNQNYMLGIADMGIYAINKLKNKNWVFEDSEAVNLKTGIEQNMNRSIMRFPLLAFLPWPSVYRYKGSIIKRSYLKFSDWYFDAGFHPLNALEVTKQKIISDKRGFEILFEDDILQLRGEYKLVEPWNFYAATFEWKRRVKTVLRIKKYRSA
ncbi:MAG: glycosyltransferase involved in cell wall biosynthesis [Sediminicola sp.]|jgi:glycosyltransferase involved in cell wall biosynthesis